MISIKERRMEYVGHTYHLSYQYFHNRIFRLCCEIFFCYCFFLSVSNFGQLLYEFEKIIIFLNNGEKYGGINF
jgi:hypothetical protein